MSADGRKVLRLRKHSAQDDKPYLDAFALEKMEGVIDKAAANRDVHGMERSRVDFPRHWEDVCNNPLLADLPYRVEINREGNIELSPHSRRHSKYQVSIIRLLDELMPPGVVVPECAVKCGPSTPVADVAWFSPERDAACGEEFASIVAPEICVEVRSPSNSRRQMEEKRADYFEAGTLECWFCDLSGAMRFYGPEGELERSRLCPEFPAVVTF